jgi:hypothetical protein
MEATQQRKPFNMRGFISIAMFTAGMILPVSGIMNHQLAFEVSVARHFWMSVHNMAATLFTVAAVAHIVLNWRPLVRHGKKIAGAMITKEAGAAVGVVLGVVSLFAMHALHVR